MRVAVAWQPPACAPEPLRPRNHLCLHSALLPVGPDGQARRGQWREVAPVSALFKPVSLPLKVDCGLQVSGEGRQGTQSSQPGWEGASLVPASYTQHPFLPMSALLHPELPGLT